MRKFNLDNVLSSPFLLGVASVMLSALTLMSLIMIFWSTIFPEHAPIKSETSIEPFEILGKEFTPIIFGNGGYLGNASAITELSSGEAVLSTKTSFSAEKYPFAEWKASGLNPRLRVHLFWRTQENPVKLQSTKLHFLRDGNHFFDVAKHPEWRGTITELSIGIFGNLRNKSFVFGSLIFQPFSFELAIKVITSEWTSSNIWRANSVNFSTGTISGNHFYPGLFFGTLFLLSLVFIEILRKVSWALDENVSKPPRTQVFIAAIFFCWLGLDLPRMIGRFEQAKETNFIFSGKTLQERAANAEMRCIILHQYWDERNQKYRLDCSHDTPLPNF